MTEIDFVMAIGITIAVITFVIFYSVNTFSTDTDSLRMNALENAKAPIADQLMHSYLADKVKHSDVMLREVGNSTHTENIKISLEPSDVAESIFVCDDELNDLDSTAHEYDKNITVVFSSSFSPFEKKHVNVFYRGNSTSKMTYETNVTDKNVTGAILSEGDEQIISYDKCSSMMNKTIEEVMEDLGTDHYFQLELEGCSFGPNPPETDVVTERIPVLIEDSEGKITSDVAILRVWL